MPAIRQPDVTFRNQVSDARFQTHASDVIFCEHTSDVQYESRYVKYQSHEETTTCVVWLKVVPDTIISPKIQICQNIQPLE